MAGISTNCLDTDCNALYEGDAVDVNDTYWFTCPKCGYENEQRKSPWK